MGYAGFDLPIAPTKKTDHRGRGRPATPGSGTGSTTRSSATSGSRRTWRATRTFDPSSLYRPARSRRWPTSSRGLISPGVAADMMAGPIVFPYGVFPTTDFNQPIWSDALQDWANPRYRERPADPAEARRTRGEAGDLGGDRAGRPLGDALAEHGRRGAGFPRTGRRIPASGVCMDSAHVVLGSDGPASSQANCVGAPTRSGSTTCISRPPTEAPCTTVGSPGTSSSGRSSTSLQGAVPGRGLQRDPRLPQLAAVDPPEVLDPRRGRPNPGRPDAYEVARRALAKVRGQIARISNGQLRTPPTRLKPETSRSNRSERRCDARLDPIARGPERPHRNVRQPDRHELRPVPRRLAAADHRKRLGPFQDLPGFWEGTGFSLVARPDFSGGARTGFTSSSTSSARRSSSPRSARRCSTGEASRATSRSTA